MVISKFLKKLGPGLITGAADDDPSGIATYSQAGTQFGPHLLWSLIFTFPLMVVIQMISAIIGRSSGHGLAGNLRRHYSRPLMYFIICLLLCANLVNIGADLAAMGDAMNLLIEGNPVWYALGFALVSLVLQIFIPYRKYVRVLKWLTLALIAYVATAFIVHVSIPDLIRDVFQPHVSLDNQYITTLVAIFGTTISPYLFFWQASQEVEDLQQDLTARPLIEAPEQAPGNLKRIRLDTTIGMAISNIVAFCIMLTAALTLHVNGITNIETSADAAKALRPIAGDYAFLLFSLGIIGTGLLAIPVLAGSAAYAMAGAFDWDSSLELAPGKAIRFYAIIGIATLIGAGLCFAPINPIKALYWSAVLNGILAIPIMVLMMFMANNPRIVGDLKVGIGLKAGGWGCTGVMTVAVIYMGYSLIHA